MNWWMVPGVLTAAALLALSCTDEPDIVFSGDSPQATVHGRVNGTMYPVRVSLIRGRDTVAHTWIDSVERTFAFRQVTYDYYALYYSSGEYSRKTAVSVDRPVLDVGYVHLYPGGTLAYAFPASGVVIVPAYISGDTAVRVRVSLPTSAVIDTTADAWSVEPPALSRCAQVSRISDFEMFFSFSPECLFASSELTISLRFRSRHDNGVMIRDSLLLRYPIDSAGLDSVLVSRRVSPLYPRRDSQIDREDSLVLGFAHPMNRMSVESRIRLSPDMPLTFFWSDSILTVVPSNSIPAMRACTLTLGSGAVALDSTIIPGAFSLGFQTGDKSFFSDYRPLRNAVDIATVTPFYFESQYRVDPAAFAVAFSIEPPVDSVQFVAVTERFIEVRHAALVAGTDYRITIDAAFASIKGTSLETEFVTMFRTRDMAQ